MMFNDRVLMIGMEAPEGWKQKLTILQYEKLDDEKKKYYKPLFAKYRTVKHRTYDFDTGQFCGWEPHQVGIGAPIGYEYVGYWAALTIDQLNSSNVLMERVLNKKSNWTK
jgi:hypothetical protein